MVHNHFGFNDMSSLKHNGMLQKVWGSIGPSTSSNVNDLRVLKNSELGPDGTCFQSP